VRLHSNFVPLSAAVLSVLQTLHFLRKRLLMCSITGSGWLSIEKVSHQAQHVHACALAPSLDEGVYKARPSQHKPQQMHAGKFQQKMFFLTCNAYQTHSRTPRYSKNSLQLPLFFLYTLHVQDEQTDLTLHQLRNCCRHAVLQKSL